MNTKKAFTLLEVVISITLFMIFIIFVYKTLDQTKHSNKIFEKQTKTIKDSNRLYNIFLEDIAESTQTLSISYDKDKNARLIFTSNNTYHNPYYTNITYLISSNDKLVRIESKDKFKFSNTSYEFYENAYVDVLLEDIEYFDIKKDKKQYVLAIKQKNKKRVLYSTYLLK
ncbi:prepilin-type N-terminal cleavage/methylation domain-containing protein [Arcobacter roscoffensis]|uniref:Prepilin-type N-terminal cleavage/methylation domain-containing protein n=1 Tax=Arcobacter roscoffensis TaxID=2961520 RepID=A0ABY5E3R0_9BACT|nr:prepilin-type N-terminal cleavage/methylation domain-containing protein [Arcobacter roscoffensis]UTJ05758.1 prepilin-type N-terminal cleavage/methylation domain-containing protein [Arcobacter roscoffensis]